MPLRGSFPFKVVLHTSLSKISLFTIYNYFWVFVICIATAIPAFYSTAFACLFISKERIFFWVRLYFLLTSIANRLALILLVMIPLFIVSLASTWSIVNLVVCRLCRAWSHRDCYQVAWKPTGCWNMILKGAAVPIEPWGILLWYLLEMSQSSRFSVDIALFWVRIHKSVSVYVCSGDLLQKRALFNSLLKLKSVV